MAAASSDFDFLIWRLTIVCRSLNNQRHRKWTQQRTPDMCMMFTPMPNITKLNFLQKYIFFHGPQSHRHPVRGRRSLFSFRFLPDDDGSADPVLDADDFVVRGKMYFCRKFNS